MEYIACILYGIHTRIVYFWVEVLVALDLRSLAEGGQSGTVHCHPLEVALFSSGALPRQRKQHQRTA